MILFWRAERARKIFGFWHLIHADKWVLGNYWRQIIFFTVPLSKIIFFSQNRSKEFFFEKNPSPPPRISNGPCLMYIEAIIQKFWRKFTMRLGCYRYPLRLNFIKSLTRKSHTILLMLAHWLSDYCLQKPHIMENKK